MSSMLWQPTRGGSDRTTKMFTIDSGDHFYHQVPASNCTFETILDSPIVINRPAMIYLEGLYIGGFKINERDNVLWETGGTNFPWPANPTTATWTAPGVAQTVPLDNDHVTHFNIDIPELNITTAAGTTGVSSTPFSGKFTLPNEKPIVSATSGIFVGSDFKPFILGHLSRTAVYVSQIQPCTLDRLVTTITDQNGLSIFKEITGSSGNANTTNNNLARYGAGNPPLASRRIVLQFIIAENT